MVQKQLVALEGKERYEQPQKSIESRPVRLGVSLVFLPSSHK